MSHTNTEQWDNAELWMGSRKATKAEMAGIRLCAETHKMMLQIHAEQIFDDLDKEVRAFRLNRTGQQEVSIIIRKLKQKWCGDKK